MAVPLNRKKIPAVLAQAIAFHQQGKLDEAAPLYEAILAASRTEQDALLNYSTLHLQRGNLTEAEALLSRLTTVHPKFAYGHYAHGNVLHALKRYTDASAAYDRALALDPKEPEFYHNYGVNLSAAGQDAEAIAIYNRALRLPNPSAASAFNLGFIHGQNNALEEAIASYDTALRLNPNYADAHSNRAMILNRQYAFEDALEASDKAIALNPHLANAHNSRGNALFAMGRTKEALEAYYQANALDHGYVDPYWNLAVTHLALGDYPEGWALYECRWQTDAQKHLVQDLPAPLWLGNAPISGKVIYLYYEQGFGDFIQMARYIPLLLERGAIVLLETFPALRRLFEESFQHPNLRIIAGERPLPRLDYQCPIMSLPLAMGTTLATIPANVPYLKVPEEAQTRWRTKLGPKTRLRVGLAWSGAAHHKNDHNRSIPLEALRAILDLPFEFHSLQKEIKDSDAPHLGAVHTHTESLADFTDTAALANEMDLILSVDTSVAHLAGALAKPLWVMLPRYSVDYRWLLNREDSPWYPTARLFRQQRGEQWAEMMPRVAQALSALSSHSLANADEIKQRGMDLESAGNYLEAIAAYREYAALVPKDAPLVQFSIAQLLLLTGDYENGLPLYESRWQLDLNKQANRLPNLWLGETDIAGKTLIIPTEQGFGDMLQFCRYVPMLEARGINVILEVKPTLQALLRSLSPIVTIYNPGDPVPHFDYYCPLMSLPYACRTTLATIPNTVPYLAPTAEAKARIHEQLGEKTKPRIGIVWSGSATNYLNARRSIPLTQLLPLFEFPFEFHSLQKEILPEDATTLQQLGAKLTLHGNAMASFDDTAALVEEMDLVISTCTSLAHLTGALAKPLWMLLSDRADWRWHLAREDSPWYPTARLFRQRTRDDWPSAISAVIEALKHQF